MSEQERQVRGYPTHTLLAAGFLAGVLHASDKLNVVAATPEGTVVTIPMLPGRRWRITITPA